jgi:L-fucose isomerase-like protein
MNTEKLTFGVIVGNRGFFPDILAMEGRKAILDTLERNGYGSVVLSDKDSKYGAVETLSEAKKCAELFKQNEDKIAGIIVTLPNFGDERGVAEAIKRSGINVPILVQAEPDIAKDMSIVHRRDSFCGKISVCNNLLQAQIPFTLTDTHTVSLGSEAFARQLDSFASVCRIVRGLKNVRFGAIGARPAAFNTVRYSEKILESYGIAVEPVDLSEIIGRSNSLADSDAAVIDKLGEITSYVQTTDIPQGALLKMAKLGTVIDQWCDEVDVQATTIQCWTSIEEFYGVVPCTLMSMLSEKLAPSACEVDVMGLLGMYVLQLAAGKPSALLDWNNNYGDDPDKCVLFHCSNLPKSFFEKTDMQYQAIIAGSVGKENTFGTICGRIAPNPATFLRTSTDDLSGTIACYLGEGEFTDDKVDTFGGYGVMRIPNLQELLRFMCENGFEHHVAVNISSAARAINEALTTYMGWDVYYHG